MQPKFKKVNKDTSFLQIGFSESVSNNRPFVWYRFVGGGSGSFRSIFIGGIIWGRIVGIQPY